MFVHRDCVTTNVFSLARTIHGSRAFDRIPIPGDPIEEVGLDKTNLLDHCRLATEHVQGCWVIDTLLGNA